MNLVFAGLLVIISSLFLKQIFLKKSKKTVTDERTEFVGNQASRATFVIFTTFLAISSFTLIFFGRYAHVKFDYVYYVGVILSYLTCLILVLYTILYAYFNKSL